MNCNLNSQSSCKNIFSQVCMEWNSRCRTVHNACTVCVCSCTTDDAETTRRLGTDISWRSIYEQLYEHMYNLLDVNVLVVHFLVNFGDQRKLTNSSIFLFIFDTAFVNWYKNNIKITARRDYQTVVDKMEQKITNKGSHNCGYNMHLDIPDLCICQEQGLCKVSGCIIKGTSIKLVSCCNVQHFKFVYRLKDNYVWINISMHTFLYRISF